MEALITIWIAAIGLSIGSFLNVVIARLPNDESDRAIVSATIGMARALKLKVVAEGVETTAQRDYLAGLSCDSFQGYLCAPGLDARAFEGLWDRLRVSVVA